MRAVSCDRVCVVCGFCHVLPQSAFQARRLSQRYVFGLGFSRDVSVWFCHVSAAVCQPVSQLYAGTKVKRDTAISICIHRLNYRVSLCLFACWCLGLFVCPFVRLFVRLFVPLFLRSFIGHLHLYVCLFVCVRLLASALIACFFVRDYMYH